MRSCHVAKGNFRSEMDLIICRHDRGVGSKKSDRMMVFKKKGHLQESVKPTCKVGVGLTAKNTSLDIPKYRGNQEIDTAENKSENWHDSHHVKYRN